MEYRYFIYKQNSIKFQYPKYDFNYYAYVAEIRNNSQWGLKIERDREFPQVIRENFSGEVSVSGADYDFMIGLENEIWQYVIVIKQKCNGVWVEFWKGFFSYLDYKVDRDRCVLSFEPKVWDKYSPVFDEMNVDRNILVAESGYTIFMDSFEYDTEEISWIRAEFPPIADATYTEYAQSPLPVPNKYYLFSQQSIFVGGLYYNVNRVYKREIAYAVDDITAPPGFGANGVPVEEIQPGLWKWARPIGDMAYVTYTKETNGDGDIYQELILPPSGVNISLNGCIRLSAVLDYYASNCGLTYTSNLFNDDPCPIGGDTLSLTYLQQISNLRASGETASRGFMMLKNLLMMLRDTFNAHWYIDSNGYFRVEHLQYFENGLTYTIGPETIEVNLLTQYPERIAGLSRYEWSKPEFYRYQKLDFQFSYFTDWVDAKIEYKQLSIHGNESDVKSVEWGTDIISMYEGRSELPKKGWVLLNVDWQGSGGMFIMKVIRTIGAISGAKFQNARFSSANLLRDFWNYGRLLPMGWVNGNQTNFESTQRLKKQVDVTIPQCCTDIDYNGLFRTGLGNGIIETAEYEAKTGILKMNLIYE